MTLRLGLVFGQYRESLKVSADTEIYVFFYMYVLTWSLHRLDSG